MLFANERVCVYGATGKYGSYHLKRMLEYGTNVVCGVSKNRIVKSIENIPVVVSLEDYVSKLGPVDTAILFVPAPSVLEAFQDAASNGVKNCVIITEHVPVHDTLKVLKLAKYQGINVIGPNCPGVIHPLEKVKVGIMPERYFKPGKVAIISRSGTLMYETAKYLSDGIGVAVGLGLGGDPVVGTNVSEAFDTVKKLGYDKVLVIGEIGGEDEISGIKHALKIGFLPKDIVAFFAGRHAPEGKKMGHAGAIVEGEKGKVQYKESILNEMGIRVVKFPWEVGNAWLN
ncbi:MAG: CoA-binding protein [Fervidobacterium sp.]|uniref:Succinyl-CoA synthetase alpha subunit n=1 Tax=Fervidobacterium gondwanense DSM 13020 TaxID=1121883 RepID=A0A1M7SDB8_FERGO|nr:CoA-binding protein [Fervidobacterium gondwanense]UXF01212.1 CoA-binding protein [Fervidobacterium riparium]SHN56491.1 succinyl-CoA synthetase alpha subunit [Fervidobacterium gondwanense DSM 13020]